MWPSFFFHSRSGPDLNRPGRVPKLEDNCPDLGENWSFNADYLIAFEVTSKAFGPRFDTKILFVESFELVPIIQNFSRKGSGLALFAGIVPARHHFGAYGPKNQKISDNCSAILVTGH